jgi:2,3-bisphosphoglycerate-dependent phosphoglycerate mutase
MGHKTMILIRHAQSAGPAPDSELTPEGTEQATALSERLSELGVDGAFSSPYRRALATIVPYAERAGLEVTVLNDLHERILSPDPAEDWLAHIARSFADVDYKLHGGESLRDTRRRALQAIEVIAASDHAVAAAVSHGNLMASVFRSLDEDFGFSQWRSLRNPDLFELTLKNGAPIAYRRMD